MEKLKCYLTRHYENQLLGVIFKGGEREFHRKTSFCQTKFTDPFMVVYKPRIFNNMVIYTCFLSSSHVILTYCSYAGIPLFQIGSYSIFWKVHVDFDVSAILSFSDVHERFKVMYYTCRWCLYRDVCFCVCMYGGSLRFVYILGIIIAGSQKSK